MNAELLEKLGQIAGIGGLSIGLLLLVFRQIIAKNFFPNLTKEQAYKIIQLIIILSFTTAIIGMIGWFYLENKKTTQNDEVVKNIFFISNDEFSLLVSGNGTMKKAKSELIVELDDILIRLDTVKNDNYAIKELILSHSFDSPQGYKQYNISKPISVNKLLNKKNIDLEFEKLEFKIPLRSASQIENSFFVLEIFDKENGYVPAFTNQL